DRRAARCGGPTRPARGPRDHARGRIDRQRRAADSGGARLMAVSAPSDRRFRRAHVRPARRRSLAAARWRLAARAAAITVAVAGAGWYGTHAMATARVLEIDAIEITGNRHLPDGEVMTLLAGLEGRHILLTDLEPWRKRLMGSPWVEQAALRRVLPSTVEVVISERAPMALGRI